MLYDRKDGREEESDGRLRSTGLEHLLGSPESKRIYFVAEDQRRITCSITMSDDYAWRSSDHSWWQDFKDDLAVVA